MNNLKKIILPLFCITAILLSGCSQTTKDTEKILSEAEQISADTENAIQAETETEEEINEMLPYHGSWEGTLWEGAVGIKLILDCNAIEGRQQVLVSCITDITNYYYQPAEFKLEDGRLIVWWNDEANRAMIEFQFDDAEHLVGEYTQYSSCIKGEFTKTNDAPANEKPTQKIQENLIQIIKENSNFNRKDSAAVWFGYDYSDPNLTVLRETYNLDKVAGEGDTQSQAIQLLNWVSSSISYAGRINTDMENQSLALLEYSYHGGAEKGLDCYHLSVVLEEACLAMGIQARTLLMIPASPMDNDTHVVVMAYIPERETWIMLDPSYNAYLSDQEGNVLSPQQIRQKIANQEEMILNDKARNSYISYYNYLAKNMFCFCCISKSAFGSHIGDVTEYYLTPAGFDMKNWYVENLLYKNSSGMALTEEETAAKEELYRTKIYNYATEESFWKK